MSQFFNYKKSDNIFSMVTLVLISSSGEYMPAF